MRVSLDGTLSLAEVQVFGRPSSTQNAQVSNHFTARKIPGRVVELTWMVDYTKNTIQYEIEKQTEDGSFAFLDMVISKDEHDFMLYDYIDTYPSNGDNVYRIKVIYQHETEYLDPLVVNLEPSYTCLLYTSPSPRDRQKSRMPSSA